MKRIFVSAVMDAPIAATWKVLRDFNGLPDYNATFFSRNGFANTATLDGKHIVITGGTGALGGATGSGSPAAPLAGVLGKL